MVYETVKSFAWLHLVQNYKEPLTIIITTHLYTEYALNFLIDSNCKNPNRIINNWNFARKLELCYQLGLIEDYLYSNISKLNKIRNEYAHNLTVNFREMDLHFQDPKNRVNLENWKSKGIMEERPSNTDIIDAMIWVGALTFAELHNKIVGKDQLNIVPPK